MCYLEHWKALPGIDDQIDEILLDDEDMNRYIRGDSGVGGNRFRRVLKSEGFISTSSHPVIGISKVSHLIFLCKVV
jgi:hypothetical protein